MANPSFYEINIGQISIAVTLLFAGIKASRLLDRFEIEHEMLMDWYCKVHKIRPQELLTRRGSRIFTLISKGRRKEDGRC